MASIERTAYPRFRRFIAGSGLTLAASLTDPFALEVHRPVQPEDPPPGLPELPTYVPREHDTELGLVVQAAAEGRSRIAVLVGGSATGKTRACWEALQILRDRPEHRRLWHPIGPARPDAALWELPGIGPQTVVWLNEAQFLPRRMAGWVNGSPPACVSCCATRIGPRCWCWPRCGPSSGTG